MLVRWLDPGNWLAVAVRSSDSKAVLKQRKDDARITNEVTSTSALSLTSGNWYTAKVVIDDDPNDANLQRLRFQVDTDGDGSFSDEAMLLNTTVVDDDWSAGYVGLYKGNDTTVHQWDDFQVGFDNNDDGDIADGSDDVLVSDDFNSNQVSLSYDNNGNLTNDGVYMFEYDAWNRLRKTVLTDGSDETTIGEYEYYGDNRRSKKTVSNRGAENVANDGGNTTVLFYYDNQWRILETRNGSSQTTFQHLWGTQYFDELIWIEKNGDPTESNDTNPDDQSGESTADERYFVHQDRNWNVVALSEYDTAGTNNGRIVERYGYTPYGSFVVLKGDSGSGELGSVSPSSTVGNPFAHQGLPLDHEKDSYQNRHREYGLLLRRFTQRDPLGFVDGMSQYGYISATPIIQQDPIGLTIQVNPWGACPWVASSMDTAMGTCPTCDPTMECGYFGDGTLFWNGVCSVFGGSLCGVIDDACWDWRVVTVVPVWGSTGVSVDDWDTNEVDLSDIACYPVFPPVTQPSISVQAESWAHVIEERLCKADGFDYPVCHPMGIMAQNTYRASMGTRGRVLDSFFSSCNGIPAGVDLTSDFHATCFFPPNGGVIWVPWRAVDLSPWLRVMRRAAGPLLPAIGP